MKIKLQTTLKHILQWFALLVALLGVSHYVWGGTFTLRGSFNSWSNSAWIDNDIYVFLNKNTTYDFQLYGWSKYFKIKGSTHITGDVTDWWLHKDASNNVYIDTDTSSDGYYKFTRSNESYWDNSWEYMKLSVAYPDGFKIKYPWYGESGWNWSADMTSTRNGNVFRCEGRYNGTSVNLGFGNVSKTATPIGNPSNGDNCVFIIDAKGVGKTVDDATIKIAKKVYSIIGYATDNSDFTTWHSMTLSGSYYYFDCNYSGTFKFSDCAEYDAWFYKQFSNKANSESGAVAITNLCSSDGNCTLGEPPSGYTYPIRVWIDPTNHKVWALSTVDCSTHPVATTGTATGIGLQGATLPITISSSASGTCTPTKVGVKLYTSSTCDEEVSGYTFDEATWTTDQAYNIVVSGLSPGNTYYYRGYVKSSLGTNEDTSTSPVKSFRTTPCTAPNVTAISNNSQTKCKGVAASQMVLTVEGGVTPYSYAWKQNGSKSTTGATGATGSSNLASYTPPTSTAGTMYYYCVVSSATPCSSSQFSPSSDSDYATIVTNEVPSLSVVPTGTVKNFTPVTITSSNVNINSWSSSPAANDQTVYFYDNAAKSVKFKATVARSSNQTYTITATTAANCSANTSVTVTKDTETCE